MSAEPEKKFDFSSAVVYLQDMACQINRTEVGRLNGEDVVMLKQEGAYQMANNLLKLVEWLIRTEEHLNINGGYYDKARNDSQEEAGAGQADEAKQSEVS
jgi:hypothetical protein